MGIVQRYIGRVDVEGKPRNRELLLLLGDGARERHRKSLNAVYIVTLNFVSMCSSIYIVCMAHVYTQDASLYKWTAHHDHAVSRTPDHKAVRVPGIFLHEVSVDWCVSVRPRAYRVGRYIRVAR